MARCAHCGAETQLFSNGSPICIECDAAREAEPDQLDEGPTQARPTDGRRHLIGATFGARRS